MNLIFCFLALGVYDIVFHCALLNCMCFKVVYWTLVEIALRWTSWHHLWLFGRRLKSLVTTIGINCTFTTAIINRAIIVIVSFIIFVIVIIYSVFLITKDKVSPSDWSWLFAKKQMIITGYFLYKRFVHWPICNSAWFKPVEKDHAGATSFIFASGRPSYPNHLHFPLFLPLNFSQKKSDPKDLEI